MTPKFDTYKSSGQPLSAKPVNGNYDVHTTEDRMDSPNHHATAAPLRDRFELLSAYLDGEITAAERRQVEDWLANDPSVQCLYARLLKLRQGMRSLSVPVSDCSVERTVSQVFSKLERRPRITAAWGGLAIAALFIGALHNNPPSSQNAASELAQTSVAQMSHPVAQEALMIALDRPVIEIPKSTISTLSVPDRVTSTAPRNP
jgi:anti-sigma factor RsiW